METAEEELIRLFHYHYMSNEDEMKLDEFFYDVYYYYYKKGVIPIITSNITDIISLIYGLWFTIFIFIILDWDTLLKCGNDITNKDCGNISSYFKKEYPNFFVICLIIMASLIIVYKIMNFLFQIHKIIDIHNFYKKELKISQNELQTMQWKDVIAKISEKKSLTIEEITNIILKKENYFIALFDKNIINIDNRLYTKQLDMNLQYILFSPHLNVIDVQNIKRKFVILGILNIICSPIIFIYQIMYFFVKNVDEFYLNKDMLGPRRYTLYAKLKFRNYNELDHFFEERINKSMKYALEYTKQFPYPTTEVIAKFVVLISGGFVGFFIILSILDESILLYVKCFDRTLLFYTAIVSAISSVSRGFVKSPEETVYNPSIIMEKVCKYTGYSPKNWDGKYNT